MNFQTGRPVMTHEIHESKWRKIFDILSWRRTIPNRDETLLFLYGRNIFLSVLSNKVIHGRSSYLKSVSTLAPYFGTVILENSFRKIKLIRHSCNPCVKLYKIKERTISC